MFGWRMFLAYDLAYHGHRLNEGPLVVEFPKGCNASVLGVLGWSDKLNLRGTA